MADRHPRILLTTSSRPSTTDLRRHEAYTGRNYSEAVATAGGIPVMAASLQPELAASFLDGIDGLLFTGGVDVDPVHFGQEPHPDLGSVDTTRDAFELELYRSAREAGLPILGICRGLQVMNIAQGGTLHQHLPASFHTVQHSQKAIDGEPVHTVRLLRESALSKAFGSRQVRTNSYHHQGIDQVGAGLQAVAHSADGLVEAVEGTSGAFLLGVQWHPEMSFARHAEQLAPFRLLIRATQ